MKKSIISILILSLLILTLSGCTYNTEKYVFGTYYSIKIEGSNSNSLGKDIDSLLQTMDKTLSTNVIESDICKINNAIANEWIKVSSLTADLFKLSKELYVKTDKAFNPALFPLIELWKFSPSTYVGIESSIPSSSEIQKVLPYCAFELFELDETNNAIIKRHNLAKLDFGAIAKGYAADKAYEIAKNSKNTIVDIGRTIKVKNSTSIFIADPRCGDFVAKATIKEQAIVTSGDYERYYIIDGIRYHHIIDTNGYPSGLSSTSPIISATIIGESATVCDALSTASMVLGYAEIKPIIEEYSCSALLLTETGYYTIGEQIFEIQDNTRQKLN